MCSAAALPGQRPSFHGRQGQLAAAIQSFGDSIAVDGRLDEPVWSRAALLTGFSAYLPLDNRPADDSTEVLVWYSPSHVYFGVRAFERHGAVHATLAARDRIDMDDYIQILLDPFNDRRRAFVIGVNPLGAQADGVRTEGFNPPQARGQTFGGNPPAFIDLNPDLVFDSKGRVTETGYEIEVRVPLKSLRFQGSLEQTWALQVLRYVQHSGYQQTWTPARRGSASFLTQSGTLRGISGLRRDAVVEFNPELTGSVNGSRVDSAWTYRSNPNAGANLRWRILPNLTLNATARPDFSQVEADAAQVPGDTRFALFFPERRPFFIDGIEQFDAPNNLIYTRRIAQPDFAAKLTGRFARTSLAYLGAMDDKAASQSGRDHPAFNVLRIRRDILEASTLGLSVTDRSERRGFNRVALIDTRIVFKGAYAFNASAGGSATRAASGGTTRWGPLWEAALNRTGYRYGFRYVFTGISDNFKASSGFVSRNDYVQISAYNRWSWYGQPGDLVESYLMREGFDALWLYDAFGKGSRVQETKVQLENVVNFRGGWVLSATPVREVFHFDPRRYVDYLVASQRPSTMVHRPETMPFVARDRATTAVLLLRLNTPQYERWSGRFTSFLGRDVEFFEAATARRADLTAEVDVRPTDQARVTLAYLFSDYARSRDGTRFSRASAPRVRLEYQLSRALFLRFVGQYDSRTRDALRDPTSELPIVRAPGSTSFSPDTQATRDFRVDWLVSYVPSPGTVVFAGYGSSLTERDAFRFRGLRRVRDGFFVKLSYLLRR
jgi:hypothetical protein